MTFRLLYLRWCEREARAHRQLAAEEERARLTHAKAAEHHRERQRHYEAEVARLRMKMSELPAPIAKRVEI